MYAKECVNNFEQQQMDAKVLGSTPLSYFSAPEQDTEQEQPRQVCLMCHDICCLHPGEPCIGCELWTPREVN